MVHVVKAISWAENWLVWYYQESIQNVIIMRRSYGLMDSERTGP